jgi:hypothetical protein
MGNGASTLFWLDPWINGQGIAERAPELLEIVDKRKQGSQTVQEVLHNNVWIRAIPGALTIPAIVQYLHLRERIDQVVLQPDVEDTFAWHWSSLGVYLASSVYVALFHGQTSLFRAKEVWKVKSPMEHKFFLWLILQDRCWTSERLQRHGLDNNGPCAFCVQSPEFIDHLLLYCVFSREVWFKVLRHFGWQGLASALEEKHVGWWLRVCKRVLKARCKAFDSLVALVVPSLWLSRNACVFRHSTPLIVDVVQSVLDQAFQWCLAGLVDRSSLGQV